MALQSFRNGLRSKIQIPLPLFRKQLSILKMHCKKRAKTLSQRNSPRFSMNHNSMWIMLFIIVKIR